MTARVFVISGDELIPVTEDDAQVFLPRLTSRNAALILNGDRPEPIAIILYDPRFRVAFCESCGWTKWEWDGTRFKCPCKSVKRATLSKEASHSEPRTG